MRLLTSMAATSHSSSPFPSISSSSSSSSSKKRLGCTTTLSCSSSPVLAWPSLPSPGKSSGGRRLRCLATGGDMLGDFGARDPFPAEIASNFGENVLGNQDTAHRILIPKSALSLAQRRCELLPPPPMSREDAEKLLKKVVGWRLVDGDGDGDGAMKLQGLWKVRDYGSGVELINRIYKVAEAEGHYLDLHLERPNRVRAELWTDYSDSRPQYKGGLSWNDFILAAKIDELKTLDLLPRRRVWS